MTDIMKALQKPFAPTDIEWRVQRAMSTSKGNKAIVLAYVTNRAIMNRLDEVFGVGGWRNEYKEWRDKGVLCGISCKIGDEWVTKWDGAEETQVEATKGGFSGSMKRAAVQWGIGRYLYNLDENWVDIKDRGQNYINSKTKDGYIKGYWDTPQLPSWAIPQITVDEVVTRWKRLGGTEEQFDSKIQKDFKLERNQLKSSHLLGLVKLMDLKENAS